MNCVAATRVRAQLPKPQNALHLQHGARLLPLLLMANVLLVLIIISAVKERLCAAPTCCCRHCYLFRTSALSRN